MRKKPIDWAIISLAILNLVVTVATLLEAWGQQPLWELAIDVTIILYSWIILRAYHKEVL